MHAAQPYADGITEVVAQPAGGGRRREQPAARRRGRDPHGRATSCIAADRGLCGGYNTTVIRAAEREIRDAAARRAARPRSSPSAARPRATSASATTDRRRVQRASATARPTRTRAQVAAAVVEPVPGRRARPRAARLHRFISAGRQEVVVEPLLPLEPPRSTSRRADAHAGEPSAGYEFEPEPDAILDALLPRYAESRVYAALLNAAASEHAARQRAMKAATDNADELITQPSRVDEPRPPGLDHHRDHGDRRRRRGAAVQGDDGDARRRREAAELLPTQTA